MVSTQVLIKMGNFPLSKTQLNDSIGAAFQ